MTAARILEATQAADIAASAASALHLAVQGLRVIGVQRQPAPAELAGLEWLASFTSQMAEASAALIEGIPPRRSVL